ncbi:MAG: cytochrome c oxidase subunit [Blastocatellia bacterium]
MRTNLRSITLLAPLALLFLFTAAQANPLDDPPAAREIKVTARKFEFLPKTITAHKGERIRLIISAEDVDHGFALKEFGINETIKAGQTKAVELTADREGKFEFACSVFCGDGHEDMTGELVVTGDSSPVADVKVSFDQNAPGVAYVEVNGERLRIDTRTKTYARVDAGEIPGPAPKTQTVVATKERESSKAYEPYDYHIVNLPTPKQVRRHSVNLYFTHRFAEPVRPVEDSGQDLFGLDSFSVSSFGLTYGITDRLYANVYRSPLCQPGLCKTIELGLGYHWLSEAGRSPLAQSTYCSVEGDNNFSERYTYNIQAMLARSVTKYVNLFFSPAVHINANGSGRFNPRPGFFPRELTDAVHLGRHSGSLGFGVNGQIRPTVSLLFEYTPRVGFKLGQVLPVFDEETGELTGFNNKSEAEIGFGIEKRIGRHVFSLTFTNTQATTTSRYNSSNLALPPSKFAIGFNLFRRLL